MKRPRKRFLCPTLSVAAVLTASFVTSGCLVIPHPRNIATAKGIERKKPKLDFMKDGIATKADVLRELGDFDTNASQARFFWARWQQVKVQTEWFAAGGYSAAGGSNRAWIIKNVLAGFRESDILEEHRICSEGDLISCIDAMTGFTSPPDAARALLLPSWRRLGSPQDGRAIFEEGRIAFEHFGKPTQNFTLPLSSVARLSVAHGASPEILRLSLHFKEGTQPVKLIHLEASPDETLKLVWLLRSPPG